MEVIVDVENEILEDDESDNTLVFEFTPITADFPQPMIWPLETAPQTEAFWTNYNDVDPTSGVSDFLEGSATHNGHNAIDAGPVNFVGQDQGVEVYAALDGVVASINDGEFDRQTSFNASPANYVILDHGGGWESWYWHLRRDSVQVDIGQVVAQGDRLGLVGSSGSSTGAHIHFELRYRGLPVETHFDPATYWESPVEYVGENVYLIESGITNYNPGTHFWEGPSDATRFAPASTIYVRGYYSGLRQNDLVQSVLYRPDGALHASRSLTIPQDYSSSGWFQSYNLSSASQLGIWRVDYRVNGALLGQELFELSTDHLPEIRVDDSSGNIVLDGRFTPFDFGVRSLGDVSPTLTFTVVNHGYDFLQITSLEIPAGYTVTEELDASIAPFSSDTFTVAPRYFRRWLLRR